MLDKILKKLLKNALGTTHKYSSSDYKKRMGYKKYSSSDYKHGKHGHHHYKHKMKSFFSS